MRKVINFLSKNFSFRRENIRKLVLLLVIIFISISNYTFAAPVEITYASLPGPDYMEAARRIIPAFEKAYPDIKVKKLDISAPYWQKIQTMIAGNTAPDIFWVSTGLFAQFGEAGTLLDIRKYIVTMRKEFDFDDFWPKVLDSYTYKGKLYGLPKETNMMMMFYNKKLFREAGVPYPSINPDRPWVWEKEFLSAAKKLTKDYNGDGKIDQFGCSANTAWWVVYPILWSAGGDIFNKDITKCIIDSPEAIRALQWYADLRLKYNVSPTPVQAEAFGVVGADYDMMAQGKIAIVFNNSIPIYPLRKYKDVDWDVAPFPAWEGKLRERVNLCSGGGFTVSATTQHSEEAFKFLAFLTGKESAAVWASLLGWVPTRKSIARSSDFLVPNQPPANLKFVLKEASRIRAIPSTPKWSETVYNILNPSLDDLWLGEKSAQELLPDIARRINELLKK